MTMRKFMMLAAFQALAVACAQEVTPVPMVFIEPSCDAHTAATIMATTRGVAVSQDGPEWQNGRAYWGADMVFFCSTLYTCTDYENVIDQADGTTGQAASAATRAAQHTYPIITNCDTTDAQVESRLCGYMSATEWSCSSQ
jgi:hypothetical protein